MTPPQPNKAPIANAWKWLFAILSGAAMGSLTCILEPNSAHKLWDFLRDIALVELPTIGALMTQLKKDLGIG